MATADFLVVGGGIVGVTAALEAARRHPGSRVVLLEKEDRPGRHASGRNSGVLHAGIYYPAGSLKARFSREGNRALTGYCLERDLPIRRCGKLLVATSDAELETLDALLERATANGVVVRKVDPAEARELEPAARVRGRALFSPDTASVDPAAVVRSLADDARAAGVEIRTGEAFVDYRAGDVVTTRGRWSAGYVVNAAGAFADRVARRFGFGEGYRIMPFKGRYLRPVRRGGLELRRHVYPVPDLRYPFLGVHFTVSAAGESWVGPTATPVLGREQYRLRDVGPDAGSAGLALARLLTSPHNTGLRRLALKELKRHSRRALLAEAGRLAGPLPRASAWEAVRPGIRAQLVDTRRWKLEDDFVYQADERSLHVLNAVSPAFTCALPLAGHLLDIIEGNQTV